MAVCFSHSCFQVCSREATLPQGADVVCGGKKQDLNFLCLPLPCQEAPGLRLSPAKALQPLALPPPGQHTAGGKGRQGKARRGLAGIPAPAVPVFLLHLLFSLSGPWWGTGSQGWAEPHRCQERGGLVPVSLQRHRDKRCSVTAVALVMVDGLWLCCRVGPGTALTWATGLVMLLCFPKPVKEEKGESFVLVEISLDTVPSNSRSTELRMSNPKRALETPLH